jgi:predicted ferric reductase
MAVVATALLCLHPVLVVREEGWDMLVGHHARWYLWLGVSAFVLLLTQLVVSLARRVIRLSYDRWRSMHQPFALTVLTLGFVHGVTAGDDAQGAGLFVWAVLLIVAMGSWVYARVVRPRMLLRRPYRVLEVRCEAPRVWTLTLKPPAGSPFAFLPGQFQFLRLHDSGVPSEEHPFTVASSPSRPDRISVTIKESGDFTGGISRARPGDLATVHGPFGRFSHVLHPDEEDLVFVAGGVGITPLMSMLRFMRDRAESRRVLLVHACRSAADLLFAAELEAMEAGGHPRLKLVPVLADPHSGWTGESGLIDVDRVVRLAGGVADKAFYLCCPPGLMAKLTGGLKRMGVSSRHVHADHFSL